MRNRSEYFDKNIGLGKKGEWICNWFMILLLDFY